MPYLCDLGLSGSGKSTIIKNMHIVHQGGFCHNTKMTYREDIYSNLLENAQAVASAMHKFRVEPADPSNVVSSSAPGGLMLFFTPFRVANVGTSVGVRS